MKTKPRNKTMKAMAAEFARAPVLTRDPNNLMPATINDVLYRPTSPTDKAIVKLAEAITRDGGVLEPIVVTIDGVIISGHRRRCAALVARVANVPVRIFPIVSNDPQFVRLLRTFNNQRVKTFDEITREAVVDASTTTTAMEIEAHRAAMDAKYLKAVEAKDLCDIDVRAARKRKKISANKMPMLRAVQAIINENRSYWPLTVRTVHYRLLNDPPLKHAKKPDSRYVNDQKSSANLSDLLTRARLAGLVPWESLTDKTRPSQPWRTWGGPQQFVGDAIKEFLDGYDRDPLQSQPAYIECLVEKMTAETPVKRACAAYRVPYSIGRGYSSIDARHELAQRFRQSGKRRMVLLVVTDFDPEGENIADTLPASLRDEFGIRNILAFKVALTPGQIETHGLPTQMTAKATSSRTKGFVEKHGSNNVYELEALPPATLQQILTDAIKSVIDWDAYRREQSAGAEDLKKILALRKVVQNTVFSGDLTGEFSKVEHDGLFAEGGAE